VQTAINTELIAYQNWTLRVRPSTNPNARLLVLIHGLTGDENSMWVFARRLSPENFWIIAPRAPYSAETSGFSWRPPHTLTGGMSTIPMLRPVVDGLINFIDEYSASVKIDTTQFDLMGFSQGAAIVNLVGMLYPQRVRKMAVLSGFIPSGIRELIATKPLTGKEIFVAHGIQDDMVPVEQARISVGLLEQAGAHTTYCEDEGGHRVSRACMSALENYLASPVGGERRGKD
jgi:phospholipase/carboxylesterase